MKYMRQFCIIIGFSLLGELLYWLLPLPVPAVLYGLLLLFGALCFRLLRPEAIKETAHFLIALLPLLFIAPSVNLIDCWTIMAENLPLIFLVILVSTVITFGTSGLITQMALNRKERDDP